MAEMSYMSLKTAQQAREADEKRTQMRKKAILCIVLHHLQEEGYVRSAESLLSESRFDLTQHAVCDNVDLETVLQDYESYYFVRFQKYPKLFKKITPQEEKPLCKERNKRERIKTQKSKSDNSVNTSICANQPTIMKSRVPVENSAIGDSNLIVRSIFNHSLPKHKPEDVDENDGSWQKLLRPFKALSTYNSEWKELAELISKEIYLESPNIHWNDIIGLEEAKRLVKEAVVYPLKYPELFSGILTPWKGLLLFGPPGTGKTLLAKAVATECRTTFFNISASTIVSKWRGDSEKLVKVLFDLARHHAPSTIFLDELDALASHRDSQGEHEGSRRMKTELLIQLDGLAQSNDSVFLLTTSNLPWELDPAILRRLDKHIFVDLPSLEAREAMFHYHLPPVVTECVTMSLSLQCDLDYQKLAQMTEGYSGFDIKLVCKEAAMESMRKVISTLDSMDGRGNSLPKLKLETIQMDGVEKALKRTKPSAAHLVQKFHSWGEQFGSM